VAYRKLFLHIGTEKTATTSIQDFLYLNREGLSARGIKLFDCLGVPNNQKLVACFQNHIDDYLMDHGVFDLDSKEGFFDGFLDEFKRELDEKSGDGGVFLITSELFHSRLSDQESIVKLHGFLRELFDDITVLCYLREQSSLASSFYSTRVKAGATDSLQEYLEGVSEDSHYYNYGTLLEKWSKAFGRENISVRVFERSSLRNSSILDDFLGQVSEDLLSCDLKELPKKSNRALGVFGVEIARVINEKYPRYDGEGKVNHFRWELIKCLSDSRLGVYAPLQNPKAREIYEMFLESNAHVAKDYLGIGGPLFLPPDCNEESGSYLSSDRDLAFLMADFFSSLFGSVVQDRVLPRNMGVKLRSATDSLLQLPAMLSAAEEIFHIAQLINPEGAVIRRRLEMLKELKEVAKSS
jgi:hypothetical protein